MPEYIIEIFPWFSLVLGLILGSFYNVCIHRYLVGEKVNDPPRSHCPKCGHKLSWHENLPLISYAILKGRCKSCNKPISARYPLVEAISGVLATALAFWGMGLAMLLYTHRCRVYDAVALWGRLTPPRPALMGELLYVGLPIGVALFVEVTLFTLIALLVANLGEVTVAAHQVALNLTSFVFMLPLSLGMALTVRVSHALGTDQAGTASFVAWNGVLVSLLAAACNALVLGLWAAPVIGLYTHDPQVQQLAVSLITLAILFQISDALQLSMAGALRGYKDTRVLMGITLLAYWGVGLAGGHLLATRGLGTLIPPLGVHGYWLGLICGLTVAALLLGMRLQWLSHRRQGDWV